MSGSASASASASTSTNAPSLSPGHPPPFPTNPQPPSTLFSQHGPSPSNAGGPLTSTSPSTLPHSPETLRQIAEARTALEASMTNIGNSLSANLQSRAQNLHANSAALEKQEKDLVKATEVLRKENEKLGKVVGEGQKRVKELGNVQNWAEMLERDFLVLGETLRLVREGSPSSGSYSGSYFGSGSYSGSETGDADGERDAESIAGDERRGKVYGIEGGHMEVDGEGDTAMGDADVKAGDAMLPSPVLREEDNGKGKGRVIETDPHIEQGLKKHTGQSERVSTDIPREVSEEQQVDQHMGQSSDAAGSSTTATVSSGTDPSSSSIHTSASVAS